MDPLILPQVSTQCMQIFLDTVTARHVNDRIVMVMGYLPLRRAI